jgi:hypothetical protein
MELKLISGRKKTLLEFYDPKRWPEHWGRMPEMMCDLLRHLQKAEHEPAWVFTSHQELLFNDADDPGTWLVTVVAKPKEPESKEMLYRVTYALDAPWWHGTGYATDAQSAGRLVLEGLDRAVSGKKRNILFNSVM